MLCQSVYTLYTYCSKWSYKNSKKLIQNDVYLLICDVNFYKVYFVLIVFTLETTKIKSGFIIGALFSYETKFGLPSNSICIFHQKVHAEELPLGPFITHLMLNYLLFYEWKLCGTTSGRINFNGLLCDFCFPILWIRLFVLRTAMLLSWRWKQHFFFCGQTYRPSLSSYKEIIRKCGYH